MNNTIQNITNIISEAQYIPNTCELNQISILKQLEKIPNTIIYLQIITIILLILYIWVKIPEEHILKETQRSIPLYIMGIISVSTMLTYMNSNLFNIEIINILKNITIGIIIYIIIYEGYKCKKKTG